MADFELIVNSIEKNHINKLLDDGRRLDGRTLNQFRDIKIETNVIDKANGSALIHLGKTKVMCGVKLTFGVPWEDAPKKGSLFVGFETTPMASPDFRSGPPQPNQIELSRVTDRLIRESGIIDLEKLCIIEGEKVWQLNIDVYALDNFGNLFDAAAIAAVCALATTSVPELSIKKGEVTQLETSKPLEINSFPVSVTTSKIGEHYIADAELKEEQIADARFTLGLTDDHIVSGQKGGENGIKSGKIMEILDNSIQIADEIRKIIKEQLPK